MRRSGRRWLGFFLGIAAAGLLVHPWLTTVAWAQSSGTPQALAGQADMTMLRTVQDMAAFDAAHPDLPVVMPPFLPTMDFAQYLALKAAAGAAAGGVRPGAGVATLQAGPPTLGALQCNGFGQLAPIVGGGFPPDTHAAVGANHFGQIVNSAIRFYTKALTGNCPTAIVLNSTLSGFFGYTAAALFDPRIVYDLTFNHWIVSAEAFAESTTVQRQFIAISVDSNPTNGFFIYSLNIRTLIGAGVFWDYPQIGYDEEAIILTGNMFNPGYIGSMAVFFSKNRMYAGLTPIDFCGFVDAPLNIGTIAPPIVLDQGPYTALVAAAPGANFIRVTKWIGTSHACPTFLSSADIATLTTVPPDAQQPGFPSCAIDPAHCLDTLDGRFQNASTQFGEPDFASPVTFWQVRTDVAGAFPTPKTYRVNADALTIDESCPLFASSSSFDFNPSIVANEAGTFFTTWSSTDPVAPRPANAQVRIGGKKLGDACGVAQTGIVANESGNPLTGNLNLGVQRWGDYSAVTLDPANHTKVWGVNEKVQAMPDPTKWKSFLFNMTNP